MRAILCGSLLALLCLGTDLFADDERDEKIDAKKLIGKWGPAKEGMPFVLELKKDGKLTVTFSVSGLEQTFEGTYTITGNKFSASLKNSESKEKPQTVTKLTDTEFVTIDEKGAETKFVRLKDK